MAGDGKLRGTKGKDRWQGTREADEEAKKSCYKILQIRKPIEILLKYVQLSRPRAPFPRFITG